MLASCCRGGALPPQNGGVPGPLATGAGCRADTRALVTPASSVPGRTAWMSRPCRWSCWSCMAETSTPYPRSRTGAAGRITGHGSTPKAQEHQGQSRARQADRSVVGCAVRGRVSGPAGVAVAIKCAGPGMNRAHSTGGTRLAPALVPVPAVITSLGVKTPLMRGVLTPNNQPCDDSDAWCRGSAPEPAGYARGVRFGRAGGQGRGGQAGNAPGQPRMSTALIRTGRMVTLTRDWPGWSWERTSDWYLAPSLSAKE